MPRELRLGACDADGGGRDRAPVEAADAGPPHEPDRSEAPDDVADVGEHPVAHHRQRGDASARPRHRDQVVPGEELGPGDHDQDQAEAEAHSREQSRDAEAERGFGDDDGGEQRAERDERAGEHRQHEQRHRIGVRLRHARALDLARDLGGRMGVVGRGIVVHPSPRLR